MIKKYSKFYESFVITKNFVSVEDAFEDFSENLINAKSFFEDNDDNMGLISYGYASQYGKKYNPDSDFNDIDKYMSRAGWTLENVKRLSESYQNFNRKIYDVASTTACAAFDYYLYVITNKKFELQGYKWDFPEPVLDEEEGNELMENEYLIKFRYGWHRTKYGRLVIEQNMGSVENFLKMCFNFLPEVIFVDIVDYLDTKFISRNIRNQFINRKREISKSCFTMEDKDEYFLDSNQLLSIFNEEFLSNNKSTITQNYFDEVISIVCEGSLLKCKVLSPGDIRINL